MEREVEKVVRDIKKIKIQGATNIAQAALKIYSKYPKKSTKNKLLSARPTEPMLANALENVTKLGYQKTLKHFGNSQEKIGGFILKLIKSGYVIFTHCHSTNVVKSLINAKKKGKRFEVYNTETRPLYQGRKTAKQLKRAGVKVTMFVDSALGIALNNEQETKDVDLVLLGADAITKEGVVNKVGSETIAILAKENKIPVYIVADSWKFSKKKVPLEKRSLNEIWNNAPNKIRIQNPAFEFIPKKYIKGIVSEYGVLSYGRFLKKVDK